MNDAVNILHKRYIRNKPERLAALAQEKINVQVAQLIYNMRTEAGLTQNELAQKVGTSQAAISRLEDSDYDGHSLTMLDRIAATLGKRLVLDAVEAENLAA